MKHPVFSLVTALLVLGSIFGAAPPAVAQGGGSWSVMTSGSGNTLESVWGSSNSNVFAVGWAGTILRYDGTAWSTMTSGTGSILNGVWGSSSSNVFAVGVDGTIVRYDGTAWSTMTSGTGAYLQGVWGSSAMDVFAVGWDGTILHYDGSAWSTMASGTIKMLRGVWGSSATDVFAVGLNGTILHYNGTAWSTMASGTTSVLTGVWGSSATDVFAVGFDFTILHYNGSTWSPMTNGSTDQLQAVWGSSSSNILAVGLGGNILRCDGSAWSPMTSGAFNTLRGVWGSSAADVFAVGSGGTIVRYNVPETISTPTTPAGPATGTVGASLTYTTGGATSNLGHSLQYQFDWGDGGTSAWSSSTSASHTYGTPGTYQVKAQARCETHTTAVSAWSAALSVAIAAGQQWQAQPLPSGTGMVLANGTNVSGIAQSGDGSVIYVLDNQTAPGNIYRSTDSGQTFAPIPTLPAVSDPATIRSLNVAPDDASVIAVIGGATVYISSNGGGNWTALPALPTANSGASIRNLAVGRAREGAVPSLGRDYLIAVANPAAGATAGGDVLVIGPTASWASVAPGITGSHDYITARLAPAPFVVAVGVGLAAGSVTLEVINTATGSVVSTTPLNPAGTTTDYASPSTATSIRSASVVLPSGYDPADPAKRRAYVAITANTLQADNDVYRVDDTTVTALGASMGRIQNISYSGTVSGGTLFAGAIDSAVVKYTTTMTGPTTTWTTTSKLLPSTTTDTRVQVAHDFATSSKVYVGTRGADSAFSVSTDGGVTFNQKSLIDHGVAGNTVGPIGNLNFTPDGSTIFMATRSAPSGTDSLSLWRSAAPPTTTSWSRVFVATPVEAGRNGLVRLSMSDWSTYSTLYFLDSSPAGVIYRSYDGGNTFSGPRPLPPGIQFSGSAFTVADHYTVFVGDNTATPNIYKSVDGGGEWSPGKPANVTGPIRSLQYPKTNFVLVGGVGTINYSTDGGNTFYVATRITGPNGAESYRITASRTFETDNTIFVADSAGVTGRTYRYVIGGGAGFVDLLATGAGTAVRGLGLRGGVLYVQYGSAGGNATSRTANPFAAAGSVAWTALAAPTGVAAGGISSLNMSAPDNVLWVNDGAGLWAYSDPVSPLPPQPPADTGSISGRVFESDGSTPIAGATVTAYDYAQQYPLQAAPAGEATADGSGNYSVTGLAAGDYRLSAVAPDHERRFQPNTLSWDDAQAVAVAAGADTSGKNFNLGPGGTISGTVRDTSSQTLANVSVFAALPGRYGVAVTTTDASGNYTLDGLAYNSYFVAAPAPMRLGSGDDSYIVEAWQEKSVSEQLDPVVVSLSTPHPTGINFTLEVGGTISGHVYQSGGPTAVAGAVVNVFDYASLSGQWVSRGWGFTDAEGYYITTGLPAGQYGIWARADGYASEWHNNTYFVGDATAVTVTVGADNPGKDFSLEPGGAISGTVITDPGGQPIAGLPVYVADYATNKWVNGTNTAADGAYTLSGLPAGAYRVATFAKGASLPYVDEFYNNTYYSDTAQQVTVTAGQTTTGRDFQLGLPATISGSVVDQGTTLPVVDASTGSVDLAAGWRKFEYRFEEGWGASIARAAFKAPGDADWRWFSTSELTIRVSPDEGAQAGIQLTTRKNTWGDTHPKSHWELVKCVDQDSTPEAGWYGQSVVAAVNQESNIHGNDDSFTSYYVGYFRVDAPGAWRFSTDSDDASEIAIDGQVVASWYDGHGAAGRWEQKSRVSILDYATDKHLKEVATNPDGTYTLQNIPAGTWKLQARAPGYVTEYYQEVRKRSDATAVAVAAGENRTGVSFTLEKGGTISGVVRNEAGSAPLANVSVEARPATGAGWPFRTITEEQGNYSLGVLPYGDYIVRAPSGKRTGSGDSYLTEYYDNQASEGSASTVTVASGTSPTGVNFTLGQGGAISGTVKNADGSQNLAGVSVEAKRAGDPSKSWYGATTDSQGSFTIGGLASGDYVVRSPSGGRNGAGDGSYVMEYYDDKTTEGSATAVTIAAGASAGNVNFTLDVGGSVSGSVTADAGGAAIANVHVFATDYDIKEWRAGSNTDSNGNYTLNGLPAGTFRLRAVPGNANLPYANEYYDNTYERNAAQQVTVTVGQTTSGKDFSLAPGGTISGTVKTADGSQNLAGVSVEAKRAGDSYWLGNTTTDSLGNYSLGGLPYASYVVRSPAGGRNGAGDGAYLTEYYNNQATEGSASTVTVASSTNPTGVSFTLAQGGTISGYVRKTDNSPIGGVTVQVFQYDSPSGKWLYQGKGTTDDLGHYVTSPLSTGQYYLRIYMPKYLSDWYSGVSSPDNATLVPVTAGSDTSGKDFTLDPGGSFSGHVYQSGGPPVSGARITVIDFASLSGPWVEVGWATTDSQGSYTTSGLPTGSYALRVKATGLATEWWDNTHFKDLATSLPVTSPVETAGKDFTLALGGSISGHTYQAGGSTPVGGVHVRAYDVATQRFVAATDANSYGAYSITGLPSGSYQVQADAAYRGLPYATEWYDNTYFRAQATAITVVASQDSPGKDFSLVPGGSISGYVKSDSSNVSGAQVMVFATGAGPSYGATTTDVNGFYKFAGLAAGQYNVRVSAAGLASEWFDDKYPREQADPVAVTPPGDTANTDFLLVPGGTISGRVYQPDGITGIADARVWAYGPTDGLLYGGARTNPDGSYTTSGMLAGSYKLKAEATGYLSEWWDNVASDATATPVTVTVGADNPGKDFILSSGIATAVTVSPASQDVTPGQTLSVEVRVDPKLAIAGVQFNLTFDPAKVTVNSVTEGNLLKQGGNSTYFSPGTINNTTGSITGTSGAINTPGGTVSTAGTFATISLTVKPTETASTALLHLSNVIVGDVTPSAVPITVSDGGVNIVPYDDWDVNMDKHVNVLDMIAVGQHWEETGTPHWIRADAKRDGVINVLDMILIGQHWTG